MLSLLVVDKNGLLVFYDCMRQEWLYTDLKKKTIKIIKNKDGRLINKSGDITKYYKNRI